MSLICLLPVASLSCWHPWSAMLLVPLVLLLVRDVHDITTVTDDPSVANSPASLVLLLVWEDPGKSASVPSNAYCCYRPLLVSLLLLTTLLLPVSLLLSLYVMIVVHLLLLPLLLLLVRFGVPALASFHAVVGILAAFGILVIVTAPAVAGVLLMLAFSICCQCSCCCYRQFCCFCCSCSCCSTFIITKPLCIHLRFFSAHSVCASVFSAHFQ